MRKTIRIVSCIVIFVIGFLAPGSNVTAQIIYSAFNDFSGASNPTPGGMWSYGYTATLGGSFILYTSTALNGHYDPRLTQWTDGADIDPNVIKNETGQDITLLLSGFFVIPATDYLYFHPGPEGDYSVVRWTAPAPGNYEITTIFQAPVNTCPTTADVHVLHNGVSLFDALVEQSGGVSDQDPRTFTTVRTIVVGDTIDFTIGVGTNGNHSCDRVLLKVTISQTVATVSIDIKPGSFPNSINPRSEGVVPVAILSTATFNATTVNPASVHFGAVGTEAAPVQSALEDVDHDGDTDMIFHFRTQDTGIVCGTTSASLTGSTVGGQMIKGTDSVNTVGC